MRLVTWNCRGGLHVKHRLLEALQADIAIVPECAEPDILRRLAPDFSFSDCEWYGDNATKGLGVFSFGTTSLRSHQSWDRRFHIFIPVEVRGPANVNVLAVWAFNGRAKKAMLNPGGTRHAIEHYKSFLTSRDSVVAGDFNASVFWDTPRGRHNFRDVNEALRGSGLHSGYHATEGCEFGNEALHTHFHSSRNPFHIDYIYHPEEWQSSARTWVGAREDWSRHSDHAPVVLDLATAI